MEKKVLIGKEKKERSQQIVEMLSSSECLEMVMNYYQRVEPLIRINNLRFYGNEETGQQSRYDTMINYLTNRGGEYYLNFINDLQVLIDIIN